VCQEPILDIQGGRHPVIERSCGEHNPFTANACQFDALSTFQLITGPNMAGKSTYLRQNALIIVMAQMGCFVPASEATIGITDRIFSRIGASDDLAGGRSTFMVEMVETATILNQATKQSFVILDEVGRGTSTYDGMALAWSVAEHLLSAIGCRTLFTTHYHELTALEDSLKGLRCVCMAVEEQNNGIIFLHKVINGRADRSYGIHVAALAGIPPKVINRAEALLNTFEKPSLGPKQQTIPFMVEKIETKSLPENNLLTKITSLNVDEITPLEALKILYEFKKAG
jgi:DNA mismatch repair protein MutS